MSKKDFRAIKTVPLPKPVVRCDELVIQLVVRTYDAKGHVIGEQVTNPGKVFRSATPDIWAAVDEAMRTQILPQIEGK